MDRSILGIVTFVLIILTTPALYSQEAFLSSGGDATGAGGTVAYSVGQTAYTHFSADEGSVGLGVQQPHLVIVVGADEPLSNISVALYPNPVKSTGFLEVSDLSGSSSLGVSSFELYDVSGRLLLKRDIIDHTTSIPMDHYENAMYFLKVICQNAEIKTFKVIKTN